MSDVHRLAEAAGQAWYGSGHPGDDAIALGVVAALTLVDQGDPDGPHPGKALAAQTDAMIAATLAEIWGLFWIARPDLAYLCEPLAGWLNTDPPDPGLVRGAAAVARACVKHGLPGTVYRFDEVDLLGHVYTEMAPNSRRSARGEYYTPTALARLMGEVTIGTDLPKGASICEPAVGTGGILLGAALAMRHNGLDPADYTWIANDVSAVAVAACAVNAQRWDLGPNVLLGVADSLTEPDWTARAVKAREQVLRQARDMAAGAATIAALRQAMGLLGTPAPTPSQAGSSPDHSNDDGDLLGTWCGRCGTHKHPQELCPRPPDTRPPARPAPPSRARAAPTSPGEADSPTLF